MDLKFSFGGASPDHGHGDAPSGIPLPFSVAPVSTSSVLEVQVRLTDAEVIAEAVSGDGVTYGRAEIAAAGRDPLALARAVRSVTARVVAELDGPLSEAVTGLVLTLEGHEVAVIEALEFPLTPVATGSAASSADGASDRSTRPAVAVTSEPFQRRTGIASGTPVHAGVGV